MELLIIGAGPAGMTAAVYAARKGLQPHVVSEDIGGQASWSSSVENYMGFRDIRGSELMQRFEEQMKAQRLTFEERRVDKVDRSEAGFRAQCRDGKVYDARAVIAATGRRPRNLGVPGEEEFRGRGISYCATCDGPLYRQARVAVIGGGNAGLQAANDLLALEAEVLLITAGKVTADRAVQDKVLGRPKLQVREDQTVKAFIGDGQLKAVRIAGPDGREEEIPVEGAFVEIGLVPNGELLDGGIARNEAGEVEVDCRCRTNVPGLFAAGDLSTACGEQIIIAAGEGAKAAMGAADYLAFGR